MRALVRALLCGCATMAVPAQLLADPMPPKTNLATLRDFAVALYTRHQVTQAFTTYAAPDLIQHNPAAQDGREAAITLFAPLFTAPGASFGVAHLILDHDLAFIHFHGQRAAGERGAAVAELYRLQDGQLAEHWDAFQLVPKGSANAHPMFGSIPAGVPETSTGATVVERRVVERFADLFYRQRNVHAAFRQFVTPDYIQHNPDIADGRDAAIAALTPLFSRPGAHFNIRHVLVGGGFAVIHVRAWSDDGCPDAAVFDIYRLQGGKIVKHWDVLQVLPAKSANPRGPF